MEKKGLWFSSLSFLLLYNKNLSFFYDFLKKELFSSNGTIKGYWPQVYKLLLCELLYHIGIIVRRLSKNVL